MILLYSVWLFICEKLHEMRINGGQCQHDKLLNWVAHTKRRDRRNRNDYNNNNISAKCQTVFR